MERTGKRLKVGTKIAGPCGCSSTATRSFPTATTRPSISQRRPSQFKAPIVSPPSGARARIQLMTEVPRPQSPPECANSDAIVGPVSGLDADLQTIAILPPRGSRLPAARLEPAQFLARFRATQPERFHPFS